MSAYQQPFGADGAKGSDRDPFALAILADVCLAEVGVHLHLVHRGRNVAPPEQLLDVPRLKVADADGAEAARLVERGHRRPALAAQLDLVLVALAEVVRGVDEVQVKVFRVELRERVPRPVR